MGHIVHVRNVNDALNKVMHELQGNGLENWRKISPRGMETLEWKGLFATEYAKPDERVLFSPTRDANPFFHFFESLWILNGSKDVEYLSQFNSNIASYSDDGKTFNAPYGHRIRYHWGSDQLLEAIKLLRNDHSTRQVVLSIWDPNFDLGTISKDIPCNDAVFLKIRDGALNITVACRSNDILWGAYGANAVQFSMLQEFIARAVGVEIGTYTQVSDSFHVYTSNEAYQRLLKMPHSTDLYSRMSTMRPYPILARPDDYLHWLDTLKTFISWPKDTMVEGSDPFFLEVAVPMLAAWRAYKAKDYGVALAILDSTCKAYDWATAGGQWIRRRLETKGVIA